MNVPRTCFVVGALTWALVVASAAWACVPQPIVVLQPRSSGPPGTQVTVDGQNFESTKAEIRWNAFDGPLLATTNGPMFSASITIPEAPEGLYTIIALVREPTGGVGGVTRAAFQVRATAETPQRAGDVGLPAHARTSSINPSRAAAGGAGLLALGMVAGTTMARRRRTGTK